ncbi:MAG TPA: hypothetical protein VIJ38_07130 [Acidobacteriaceae bacterium]
MFGSHLVTAEEAAGIIERFLAGTSKYPQEWNDFVDSERGKPGVEEFRKRCDELDPVVNRPDPQDEKALAELRQIVMKLHEIAAQQAGSGEGNNGR